MLSVSSCEYLNNGATRIYHLSNSSTVTEQPGMPGNTKLQYYDSRNYRILTPATRAAMKKAVEQHKKKWRLQ